MLYYINFMFKTAALILLALFLPLSMSQAEEIKGPDVKVTGGSILVSTRLELDNPQVEEINKGVEKEIVIYVDLFRVWKSWPDEFILGKSFTQTLRCDPVRKEYVATSLSGNTLKEKRFSSCGRLIEWALTITELKLTGTKELEPSEYFVKVTADSRLRRLPPFINLLFFFVKEKEFSISADSAYFPLKTGQ